MVGADEPERRALRRARVAVAAVFFVNGVVLATWGVRVPAIKQDLGLDNAQLGVALLGLAAGAVAAMQLVGTLTTRLGSGPVTAVAVLANCALLPAPALAWDWWSLIAALLLLGASTGIVDPAMNAHGVTVQRGYGRQILGGFHGLWSLGGLVAAAAGGLAARAGWAPLTHFTVAAVLLGVVGVAASRWLLPAAADRAAGAAAGRRQRGARTLWSRQVVLLGVIALCSFAAEGTAFDWSAVYLREDLGADAGTAAWGLAAFSLTMAAGRFVSDRLVTRFGPVRMVRAGGLVAAAGLGAALLAGHPAAGLAGFGLLGAGLAVVVPTAFSAAGQLGGHGGGGATLARVVSFGYVGVLAAPPVIGGIADLTGLPLALAVTVILALAIAAAAPAAAVSAPAPAADPDPTPP